MRKFGKIFSLGRKCVALCVAAVFICLPLSISADMRLLPEGQVLECGEESFYCYDFESTRELVLVDRTCAEFELTLNYFRTKCEKKGETLELYQDLATTQAVAMADILAEYESLLSEHKKTTESFIKAQSRDVFGGGIYILVATAAVSFSGGVLLAFLVL